MQQPARVGVGTSGAEAIGQRERVRAHRVQEDRLDEFRDPGRLFAVNDGVEPLANAAVDFDRDRLAHTTSCDKIGASFQDHTP